MLRPVITLALAAGCLVAAGCGSGDSAQTATPAGDTTKTAAAPGRTAGGAPARPSTLASEAGAAKTAGRSRSLVAGTSLKLSNVDVITSRRDHVGKAVTARAVNPAMSGRDTVIPAGAEFTGTVTAIAPAEHAGGRGTMTVEFTSVRFGGASYPVHVRVDSLETHMAGRGVTAGDAAKVGAGTAIGAVAGRVIGGNSRGTVVGAVVGTAAGTAVAVETRDTDITLQPGAAIKVTLVQMFDRSGPVTH